MTRWLLLLPVALAWFMFTALPLVEVGALSLQKINFISSRFVGFDNYAAAFSDPAFLQSMVNTLGYCSILVPGQILLALLFALHLSSLPKRWQNAGRILLYIPTLSAGIIIAGVWKWIFHANGPLNWILQSVGAAPIAFLSEGATAIPAIAFVVLVSSFGANVLIFLSAILGVDRSIIEAARLDGASEGTIRWKIIVPQIRPMVVMVGFMAAIASFQIFENIYALAPQTFAATMTFHIYQQGFQFSKYGMAAAEAVILLAIVLAMSLVKRRVEK